MFEKKIRRNINYSYWVIFVVTFAYIVFKFNDIHIQKDIQNQDAVPTFSQSLYGKKIMIDAGHGGSDAGAVRGKTLEKDLNLAIALKVQKYLESSGATVILSRTDDNALGRTKSDDMYLRKRLGSQDDLDVIVSIHQNTSPSGSSHGAEIYYYVKSEEGKLLAESMKKGLAVGIGRENIRGVKGQDFLMLKRTLAPSVLLECGFMTNSNELGNLKYEKYQEKIAYGIYLGLVEYFSQQDAVR